MSIHLRGPLAPITRGDEDRFGFEPVLQELVDGFEQPGSQGFYALFTPRGAGRTSALQLAATLAEECKESRTHWIAPFSAQKYAALGDIRLSLMHHIKKVVVRDFADENLLMQKQLQQVKDSVMAITTALAITTLDGIGRFARVGPVATSAIGALKLVEEAQRDPVKAEVNAYMEACDKLLGVGEALGELGAGLSQLTGKERIVVPLDDVDHCTPAQTLELIFTLRLLAHDEHSHPFIFIVPLDKAAVAKCFRASYSDALSRHDSFRILESIFTDWVDLPPANMDALLASRLEQVPMGDDANKQLMEAANEHRLPQLTSTPRTLHRSLNRYPKHVGELAQAEKLRSVELDGNTAIVSTQQYNVFVLAWLLFSHGYPHQHAALLEAEGIGGGKWGLEMAMELCLLLSQGARLSWLLNNHHEPESVDHFVRELLESFSVTDAVGVRGLLPQELGRFCQEASSPVMRFLRAAVRIVSPAEASALILKLSGKQ